MPVSRLYFPVSDASAVNPAADAGWEESTGLRRRLAHVKGDDTTSIEALVAFTSGNDLLYRQYVSAPMNAGVVFTTSWTIKCQIQAREALAEDDCAGKLAIKVVSQDGNTVRATLLGVSNIGPPTEFLDNATPRNKIFADGDALTAGYTTVTGDRLVVELGIGSSGVTPSGAMRFGMGAVDLPEDELATTAGAAWIEFSNEITFEHEGPTRLYLAAAEAADISTPAFEAAWEDTNEAVRHKLRHVKDATDVMADGSSIVWVAGEDALDRQYISPPMVAGIVFDTSVTVLGQIRVRESAVNDNVDQLKAGIRIFSEDGNTVRATLLAVLRHGSQTTEFATAGTGTNRAIFDGDALTGSYTTVAGDRLVIEHGYTDTSGTSISVFGRYGMAEADALQGTIASTSGCGWVQFSNVIQFKGPVRFYLPGTEAAPVSPAFDGAWEYNSEALRRKLRVSKDTSTVSAGTTIGPWTSGEDALDRQYVSERLAAGIVFDTSTTVKMQLMCRELAVADNVGTCKMGIWIVSEDGQTVRATLLAVANYSPTTTERPTTATNKIWADGDALTGSYTTVWGDRLVIEMGYTDAAGTTPEASSSFGCSALDLPINETATVGAGWIEFSNDIQLAGVSPAAAFTEELFFQPPPPVRMPLTAVPY